MIAKTKSRPQAAIFVDAENHADLDPATVMNQLGQFDIIERHAYADWDGHRLRQLAQRLESAEFQMHHVWSGNRPGAQKDKSDARMEEGIRRINKLCPEIKTIIILSGDAYFTRIVHQLKRQGKHVIVIADPLRASRSLCSAADEYKLVGEPSYWIQKLDQLERNSKYMSLDYAIRQLSLARSILSELVRKGFINQKTLEPEKRFI